jgi:hypothetical protein
MNNINWIQPYASDKNIGKEYNRMISLMPDNSWIGITDHDAMFLRPDSKAQIQHCIDVYGHNYDVFGVVTNRLWGDHQRYKGIFSDDAFIDNHINIANQLHGKEYGQVEETFINIAGLCMVFNKSTWLEAGCFNENSICLDKEFTDSTMRKGGRLAIMKGVYMFHLYRWGQDKPGQYIEHLLP